MRAGEPGMLERRFGGEPAHDRVVLFEKSRVRRERLQAQRVDVCEEIDWVVAVKVPELVVDGGEQGASLTMPAPCEVVGDVGQAAKALGNGGKHMRGRT